MCLDALTHGPNPQEQGEGWKVFQETTNGDLRSAYRLIDLAKPVGFYFSQDFPQNTWISDSRDYRLYADDRDDLPYQTGFHILAEEAAAVSLAQILSDNFTDNTYTVRKVKYRNVTAKGIQYHGYHDNTTIVAKEIFVEEEE
jgi:hypothetical protein